VVFAYKTNVKQQKLVKPTSGDGSGV